MLGVLSVQVGGGTACVMRGVGGGGMLNFLQSCSVRSAHLAPLGCGTRHSWQVVVGRWVLEVKRFRGRFQVVQACGRPIVMNCHVLKNDFSVNVVVNISLSMAQHACGCHPQFKGPAGRAISVSLKFSPCVRHAPSPRAGSRAQTSGARPTAVRNGQLGGHPTRP